jgi:membrane protease YdiL (CAAX protease family)
MYSPPAYPPPQEPDELDATVYEEEAVVESEERQRYRASGNDATFGFLIVVALAVGLTPLLPTYADMRYTIVWALMAGFGVLAWLLGGMTRIEQELPNDLAWGVIFGLIIGAPLLLIGGSILATSVGLLFRSSIEGAILPMPSGMVLAYLIFAQPLAETLFFRGVLQETRPFWLVAVLSTVWSLVLFAPMLDLANYPGVGILVGVALVLMNVMYSYVRDRNGLAAAWLCQITVNIVLLFIPYFSA